MRSRATLAFAAAAALVLSLAGTASAATYTATYTGTISGAVGGTDNDGLFGPAGDSLVGASFTAVFTYDPALGTRSTYAGTDQVVGGLHTSTINPASTTSPILSDSLTINGLSVSLDPSQYGLAEVEGAPSSSSLLEYVYTYSGSTLVGALSVGLADSTLSMTPDLTATQSYSSLDSTAVGGFLYGNDYLTLVAETVDISASAPEPGSLALLAGAIGLLVFVARRRSARGLIGD